MMGVVTIGLETFKTPLHSHYKLHRATSSTYKREPAFTTVTNCSQFLPKGSHLKPYDLTCVFHMSQCRAVTRQCRTSVRSHLASCYQPPVARKSFATKYGITQILGYSLPACSESQNKLVYLGFKAINEASICNLFYTEPTFIAFERSSRLRSICL